MGKHRAFTKGDILLFKGEHDSYEVKVHRVTDTHVTAVPVTGAHVKIDYPINSLEYVSK